MRWEIPTAKETTIANTEVREMPIVSRDERWLERWHEHNLEIRSMAGGDWKSMVSQTNGSLDSILTADGKWLLYGDDFDGKQSLFRIATAGGTPERLGDLPPNAAGMIMEISPDGSKIMISVHSPENHDELWSLEKVSFHLRRSGESANAS